MTYLYPYTIVVSLFVASGCGNSNSNQPDAGRVSCTTHEQCASNVCLSDGSCSDGSNVAYVESQGTDNPRCAKETPCSTLSSALGKQPIIKVTGTITDNVTIVDKNVTILADRGAKVMSSGFGSVITILGDSQVSIVDLEISGATGEPGHGIRAQVLNGSSTSLQRVTVSNNASSGIAVEGGTLHVTQSTIRNNAGGGVIAFVNSPATVRITNNIIYRNGSMTSAFGALLLRSDTDQTAAHYLEFNTIVDNQSRTKTGGVSCFGEIRASNNLIFRNELPLPMIDPQITGDCNFGTTLLTAPQNPGFAADYRLTENTPSSIRDSVDCSLLVGSDIDGDPRPLGAKCDLGADEFRP